MSDSITAHDLPLFRILCKDCGRHMAEVRVPSLEHLRSNRAARNAARMVVAFPDPCQCGRPLPSIRGDLGAEIGRAAEAYRRSADGEFARPWNSRPVVRR